MITQIEFSTTIDDHNDNTDIISTTIDDHNDNTDIISTTIDDHNDNKNSPKGSKLLQHHDVEKVISVDDIPNVILIHIFSFLGYRYVPILGSVSKKWYTLTCRISYLKLMYKESIFTRFSLLEVEIDKNFDCNSWENEQSSIKNVINPQNYKVSETIKKIVFGSIQIDDTACKKLESAIKWRRMILLRIPMEESNIYPENASFFVPNIIMTPIHKKIPYIIYMKEL